MLFYLSEHSVKKSGVPVDVSLVRVISLLAVLSPLTVPSSAGRLWFLLCGGISFRSLIITLDDLHMPSNFSGGRAATRHGPRQRFRLGGANNALPRLLVLGARRTPSLMRRSLRLFWRGLRVLRVFWRVWHILRVLSFLKGLVNVRGFDRHFELSEDFFCSFSHLFAFVGLIVANTAGLFKNELKT